MQRAAIFLLALATVLAGCASNTEGRPRTAVPDPDAGVIPEVDPANVTQRPVPPPSGPGYTPPNRTAPEEDLPPVLSVSIEAVPIYHAARLNFTLNGTDDRTASLAWKADLDGDGVFEVTGLGLPANVSRVFEQYGEYRATLVAHDGFHESEESVTYMVEAALITPYIDVSGTVREPFPSVDDPTAIPGYPTCEVLGSADIYSFDVPREAWNAGWEMRYNYTTPFDGVYLYFYDAAGNNLDPNNGPWASSTSDSGYLDGTGGDGSLRLIPREAVEGQISSCADSVTFHFIAFSQGWCRPARANCQGNAGEPYDQ